MRWSGPLRGLSRLESLRKQLRDEDAIKEISYALESRTDAYKFTKKPPWLRVKPAGDHRTVSTVEKLRSSLRGLKLATVCEEARCPNMGECWGGGTATIMIMGDTCTRGCRFCSVKTSRAPPPLDPDEPRNIASAVSSWGIRYVVLTSVDRDDVPDGGSRHIAETVACIKATKPALKVEVLSPDFQGNKENISSVVHSGLEVFAHNMETVERLTPVVRDRRAGYRQSLDVLAYAKREQPSVVTKTSLMLGVGETQTEIRQAIRDAISVGVEILTIGQYLRPTHRHLKVEEWVTPEEFDFWKSEGEAMGLKFVASGPLVRSSYRAGEIFLDKYLDQKRSQNNSI
mmetsp:Transcript_14194/g.29050  ORF Transcript_14194/g.29050 Transcript_14194/m.29050 type:complete len:343 (-) Transcript_14194:52-1080(-)